MLALALWLKIPLFALAWLAGLLVIGAGLSAFRRPK